MKANEAPEKLYISNSELNDSKHCVIWFKSQQNENDTEYVRTDAFIEKAERYIRSVADGLDRDDDVEAFISGFRKYMEGG